MLPVIIAALFCEADTKKIAVVPLPGEPTWAPKLALELGGIPVESKSTRPGDRYVVTTLVKHKERTYLMLRLHEVGLYAPLAKATRDWGDNRAPEVELKSAAAALLEDARQPVALTTRLTATPGPSALPTVGWSLLAPGIIGVVASGALFLAAQLGAREYRANVNNYNQRDLRTFGDHTALVADERAILRNVTASYVVFGLSVPAVIAGIVALAKSP